MIEERRRRDSMQHVIGFAECVDLPEWGVELLRTKIDTGARTSALHVASLRLLEDGRVTFVVVPDPGRGSRRIRVVAPVLRTEDVRSSTGHTETRHFVRTTLRLGPVTKEIEVSLASRGSMRYRMLLGRSALSGHFLIDVSRRYTAGRPPSRKKKRRKEEAE